MKKLVFLSLILAVFVFVSCTAVGPIYEALVPVAVTQWMTGPGLSNAVVRVTGPNGATLGTGTTDANGGVIVEVKWRGKEIINGVQLSVEKDGYAPSRITGVFLKGALEAPSVENEIVTIVANEAIIDSTNREFPEATVEITDEFGNELDLNTFPAGEFKVQIKFSDFLSNVYAAVDYIPWAGGSDAHVADVSEATFTLTTTGKKGIVPIHIVLYDYNRGRTHMVFFANVVNETEEVTTKTAPEIFLINCLTTDVEATFYVNPRSTIVSPEMTEQIKSVRGAPDNCNIFNEIYWIASEGAVGYNIYRSEDSEDEGFRKITFKKDIPFDPIELSYRKTYDNGFTLEAGTESWYKIRSVYADGSESTDSNVVKVIPLDNFKVELVSPADGTSDISQKPVFSWKPVRPGTQELAKTGCGVINESSIIYAYSPWIYDTNSDDGQHIYPLVSNGDYQYETVGPKLLSVPFLSTEFYDEVKEETYDVDWVYINPAASSPVEYPHEGLEAYKTYEWGMDFAFAETFYRSNGATVLIRSVTADFGYGWDRWTNEPDTFNRFTTGNDLGGAQ